MTDYEIELEFESECLIGSSEGFGAVIDSDIVYDETGLPYLPARRLKGLLRDSAQEIATFLGLKNSTETLFGKKGDQECGELKIPNLFVKDYKLNKKLLKAMVSDPKQLAYLCLNKEKILDYFTTIRSSTAIKDGIAQKHSLRKVRVLSTKERFYGEIALAEHHVEDFALICQNVRFIGSDRNRGLGKIRLNLLKNGKNLNIAAVKSVKERNNVRD